MKTIKSLRNHRKMMDSFNADATILSIDLNQDEDEVIIEEELPGYTWYFFIFVTKSVIWGYGPYRMVRWLKKSSNEICLTVLSHLGFYD